MSRGMLFGAGAFFVATFASIFLILVHFERVNAASRDCDWNAIMYCGALSESELRSKYSANASGDIQTVFAHYGIHSVDQLSGLVMGEVHANGNVTVNGEVVATNAHSVGRKYMDGSYQISGTKVYGRATHVSFRSGSIKSFVKMENGQFKWAVITSCGNPVKATPVYKPPPPQPVVVERVVHHEVVKPVEHKYDLDIHKKVSHEYVKPGEKFTYKIKLENNSTAIINNVVLSDRVSHYLEFESATDAAIIDEVDKSVTWNIGDMSPGEEITLKIHVRANNSAEGKKVKNTACVKSAETSRECDSATVYIEEEPEPVIVERVVHHETVVRQEVVAQPVRQELPNTGPSSLATALAGSATLTMGAFASRSYISSKKRLGSLFEL